jgi:hypothetical protein
MKTISKTSFLEWLRCPRLPWLRHHHPEAATPVDPVTLHLFETGHKIETCAQELFPTGTNIGNVNDNTFGDLIQKTTMAMGETNPVYEGTFSTDEICCRADILDWKNDRWNLNEIKMSTAIKPEHLFDVGFQKLCIERNGFKINKCNLVHIDNGYTRQGSIDPIKLFKVEDITDGVINIVGQIPAQIETMQSIIKCTEEPTAGIGTKCKLPGLCPYYQYCHSHIPKHSIYDLPFGSRLIPLLLSNGILRLVDIPKDTRLTNRQAALVESARQGRPIINKTAIIKLFSQLKYPLQFLDFETISPCLPLWNLSSPYERIPFQFSLHIQNAPSSELVHHSFLAEDTTDPRPMLIDELINKIGERGSIVAYNSGFEIGVLKKLAERFPQYKESISRLFPRFFDLITPFRAGDYSDYRTQGSASLKKIVPALIPQLAYDDLKIRSGDDASLIYEKYAEGSLSDSEWRAHRSDLLQYCHRDTVTMPYIIEKLQQIVSK